MSDTPHLAMETCRCEVCARRRREGLPPLAGISLAPAMHLTETDLAPPSKRKSDKPPANTVTQRQIDGLIEGVVECFAQEAVLRKKLAAEVAALESRCNMLESRTAPADIEQRLAKVESAIEERKWCGVWNGGAYRAGNEVTHDGSKWHANIDTESKPGTDSAWTLYEKSTPQHTEPEMTEAEARLRAIELIDDLYEKSAQDLVVMLEKHGADPAEIAAQIELLHDAHVEDRTKVDALFGRLNDKALH